MVVVLELFPPSVGDFREVSFSSSLYSFSTVIPPAVFLLKSPTTPSFLVTQGVVGLQWNTITTGLKVETSSEKGTQLVLNYFE